RPVADLVRQLQTSISLWLDNPAGWTRSPTDEGETQAAIDKIRRDVSRRIHILAQERLITSHPDPWRTAFSFSGTGSSYHRAKEMAQIYDAAAPSITSALDPTTQEFLNQVIRIVGDAVREAGGSITGVEGDDAGLVSAGHPISASTSIVGAAPATTQGTEALAGGHDMR
ncbi:MAG: hypothetical protein OXQ29_01620, partial [Rhodospirillaceae bacterium]|nr:hypothetical protein [Rhodospirillaceae bacterium]